MKKLQKNEIPDMIFIQIRPESHRISVKLAHCCMTVFRSFLPERGKKRLKMDLSLNFITVTDDLKLFAANSVSCKP